MFPKAKVVAMRENPAAKRRETILSLLVAEALAVYKAEERNNTGYPEIVARQLLDE